MASKMANKKANMRAKASKINATHSWPWVVIRIVQIILCVAILALCFYLRFSWQRASLSRRDAIPKESSTPPWFDDQNSDSDAQEEADEDFKYQASLKGKGRWEFSPYVSLGIFMGAIAWSQALSSLLSSFFTLLLYCCDKLSLKFVLLWDFFLSLVWLVGSVFMGKLINDNLGWKSTHYIAILYKVDFILAIIAGVLYVVSSGLGLRLTLAARRAAGGKYAPMPMAEPYVSPQTRGETGAAPAYSTYTGPVSGGVHDVPDKLTSEHR